MTLDTDTAGALERATARARELEQRVDELGLRLLEADGQLSQVARLEVQLREREIELYELRDAAEQRDAAQRELAHMHAEFQVMADSRSWRLTRPLRSLKISLRRGR